VRCAAFVVLLGCAGVIPEAASASFAVPKPVTERELPIELPGLELIVAGDGSVLVMERTRDDDLIPSAVDPTTLQVVRSRKLVDRGHFDGWALGPTLLYVVIDRDDRHVVLALDPMTFETVQRSERSHSAATDPHVGIGGHGLQVRYRDIGPRVDRYVDELSALGDVTRLLPRPNDDDRDYSPPPPTPWSFDPIAGRITAPDGKTSECRLHGERIGNRVWVGPRMFVATAGCCGGEPGGLFVCEAPE
jgi:hypothetical protein